MTPDPAPRRAIDANVILRYLLADVPDQLEAARSVIDSDEPLGLTAIVLAEVAWTLSGPNYRIGRAIVAQQLVDLLNRRNIVAVGFDAAEATISLMACRASEGAPGLGDALVAACARSFGVADIYSFDERFGRTGLARIAPDVTGRR